MWEVAQGEGAFKGLNVPCSYHAPSNSAAGTASGALRFRGALCWIDGGQARQNYFRARLFSSQGHDRQDYPSQRRRQRGQSALAKAIQAQARGVFLHVQMDMWLEMMPARTLGTPEGLTFETVARDGKPVVTVTAGPAQERALKGMRHAVAAMAGQGCNMVVDEVMFDAGTMAEYRALLAAHDLKTVGVFAPLEVLEAREAARGDRALGLARAQVDIVHRGQVYDLKVDTSAASAEMARIVVARFGL